MANYDRHQSLDEGDVTEEPIQNSAEDTSYRYSLSPSGNPSPTNDFSADKVAVDDVVENDNELVDVEGIDDDKEEENKTWYHARKLFEMRMWCGGEGKTRVLPKISPIRFLKEN